MDSTFRRTTSLLEQRYPERFPGGQAVTFTLRTEDGASHTFGSGTPAFAIVARSASGLSALGSLDVSRVAEAYMLGDLEVDGDMLSALALRTVFSERHPVQFLWRFIQPMLFGQVRSDRKWIAAHYDYPADFYLTWLDHRHRCYSHGVFEHDSEPLETAMARKLDFALAAVDARPGQRLLDIGAGWGAMTQHGGSRGIHVTSITLSRAQEEYVNGLIQREQLPARAAFEHLMDHATAEPYDAIVNLGVTEHLPDYRATLRKYLELLKPGGRVYLDAAAARVKHDVSAFLVKYLYPGNGSPLCLHEYLTEVARTPFRLRSLHDDRHSYYLTTKAWAEALDDSRDEVERRWGPQLYRKFRLYLWGCADAFHRDRTQAYRWVLEKPMSD